MRLQQVPGTGIISCRRKGKGKMKYLIGVDVGTSATKTVLFDEDGAVAASASREYPLYQPENGWAEQRPEDWRDAVLATLKEVTDRSGVPAGDIKGIGISGQMHGLVMLDGKGEVIRPSIIWCDQRTGREVEDMLEIMPRERWIEITANPPLTGWTAAKILWVRKHEPENYSRCRHILLPKDYIRYVLTGEFATEVSDASGMQLLDVPGRCWSKEVLKALDIDESMLGKVYESCQVTGTLLEQVAGKTGLTVDVKVVGGAGDNAAAAVGTGIVKDGTAFTTIGDLRRCICTHQQGVHRPQGPGAHMLLRGAGRMAHHGRDPGRRSFTQVVQGPVLPGLCGPGPGHGMRCL